MNTAFFEDVESIDGIVHIEITPSLMAEQTIGFIYERIEHIRTHNHIPESDNLKKYLSTAFSLPDKLELQRITKIDASLEAIKSLIESVLSELDALSLCLDFPLICNSLRLNVFSGAQSGDAFVATRKPIGRGLAFRVEERGLASKRLDHDYEQLLSLSSTHKKASRHYINGLTLLGLEDQFSGLIDAAFMQFYQGCELLCGPNHDLKKAQKYIAANFQDDSRVLQIIANHVWYIRSSYFAHGSKQHGENIADLELTFDIAKQTLVSRWLCKTLLDLNTNTEPLVREMRFYHKNSSVGFNGTIDQLFKDFYRGCRYDKITLYDSDGNKIEEPFIIPNR